MNKIVGLLCCVLILVISGCDVDYGITKYESLRYDPDILTKAIVSDEYFETAIKLGACIKEVNKIQGEITKATANKSKESDKMQLYADLAKYSGHIKALKKTLSEMELPEYELAIRNAIRHRYSQAAKTE